MSPKGSLLLHAVVLFAAQVLLHLSLAKFFFLVFVSTGADKMVVPLCWITALFYPSCLFFLLGNLFYLIYPRVNQNLSRSACQWSSWTTCCWAPRPGPCCLMRTDWDGAKTKACKAFCKPGNCQLASSESPLFPTASSVMRLVGWSLLLFYYARYSAGWAQDILPQIPSCILCLSVLAQDVPSAQVPPALLGYVLLQVPGCRLLPLLL